MGGPACAPCLGREVSPVKREERGPVSQLGGHGRRPSLHADWTGSADKGGGMGTATGTGPRRVSRQARDARKRALHTLRHLTARHPSVPWGLGPVEREQQLLLLLLIIILPCTAARGGQRTLNPAGARSDAFIFSFSAGSGRLPRAVNVAGVGWGPDRDWTAEWAPSTQRARRNSMGLACAN